MEELKKQIKYLRGLQLSIEALYQGAENDEGADSLLEVISIQKFDCERRLAGHEGEAANLALLKRAIRLSIVLQENILEEQPVAMQGWTPQTEAKNNQQQIYSILAMIVESLSFSVWSIEQAVEELHPGSIVKFDQERAAYHAGRVGTIH